MNKALLRHFLTATLLGAAMTLSSCASFQQGRVMNIGPWPKAIPIKLGSFVVEGSGYNPVFDKGVRQMLEFTLREKGLAVLPADVPDPDTYLELETVCLVTRPEMFATTPSVVNMGLTCRLRKAGAPPQMAWQGNWIFRLSPLQIDERFLGAMRHVAACVRYEARPTKNPAVALPPKSRQVPAPTRPAGAGARDLPTADAI